MIKSHINFPTLKKPKWSQRTIKKIIKISTKKLRSWKLVYTVSFSNFRAQNNFLTVSRHDDQPNKFLLGQVLSQTSQNIGKKVNLSFCNFLFVEVIVFYKVGCLFVCVTGQHDWRVKLLNSQIAIQAGHCLTGHYFEHWIWICFTRKSNKHVFTCCTGMATFKRSNWYYSCCWWYVFVIQVVVLCFAVFLGSWSPLSSTGINLPSLSASSSKGAVDYSTPSGKKKSLHY